MSIDHMDLLAPVITRMVNLSLTISAVTPAMKHALVSPLLKKSSLDPQIPEKLSTGVKSSFCVQDLGESCGWTGLLVLVISNGFLGQGIFH